MSKESSNLKVKNAKFKFQLESKKYSRLAVLLIILMLVLIANVAYFWQKYRSIPGVFYCHVALGSSGGEFHCHRGRVDHYH